MKGLYSVRTERDIVKFTEKEYERDLRRLEALMAEYPVVANAITKLRAKVLQLKKEKAALKDRINILEREILDLQHEGTPYHDLGQ